MSTFMVNFQTDRDDQDVLGFRQPILPLPPFPHVSVSEGGEVVSWSGIDLVTHLPGSASTAKASLSKWGATAHNSLPTCDLSCTLHTDAVHDAAKLLKYIECIPARYLITWNAETFQQDVDWNRAISAGTNLYAFSSPLDLLHTLPIAPTPLNSDLLQIYVKLLCRFKPSLDGNPDYNGPFHKDYVPFSIQSPLLAYVSIYTAACFLHETNHLDSPPAIAIKGQAIRRLNDLLRSEQGATSDEAIAGITQLILDEWYWGELHDLRAHLCGLREMIKLRGGFRKVGMNGLLSKMVIPDSGIAITFEIPPFLQNGDAFDFEGLNPTPIRVSCNTPLNSTPPGVAFSSCLDALNIHPVAATILDDIRFLISTIITLPANATLQDHQKIQSTARWMHERITVLPVESPEPDQSAGSVNQPKQASTSSKGNETISADVPLDAPEEMGLKVAYSQCDYVYQSVRMTALLYTSAIYQRRSFSEVCSVQDLYQLWTTMWRVSLTTWKSMLGIFLWIEVAITPVARDTPHGRFVKTMLTIAGMSMGLQDWTTTGSAFKAAMMVQAWLKGGESA